MELMAAPTQFMDGGLTIFDIDETLFHTTAQIQVVDKKTKKVVKSLSNQEYNNYTLKVNEDFAYKEFSDSDKFYKESQPIVRMLNKARAIIKNVQRKPLSKVVIITARNDFNDKARFLATFRKHGIPVDDVPKTRNMTRKSVRIERAGKISEDILPADKKYIIIRNYLLTGQFSRCRMFDDSMSNLQAFLKLKREFPQVKFEAYYANPDGSIKTVR